MTKPLIVTAELHATDLAWLDALRKQHYPPERNRLRAHLTILHALPPSAEDEVRQLLAQLATRPEPRAEIAGLMDLGGGVAFRVVSSDLDHVRQEIARAMHGLLSARDAGGWVPHVTIQNKVKPHQAKVLRRSLEERFEPQRLRITGLGLHRYAGGPWETVKLFRFRGS